MNSRFSRSAQDGQSASGLRAIDTRYRGYLFRSRLEARWAVFFDKLGASWTYEAEGYHLPSGWYLPDFYVRDVNAFFEIKPDGFDVQARGPEYRLCIELSQVSESGVWLVCGDPLNAFSEPMRDRIAGACGNQSLAFKDVFPVDLVTRAALAARQARFEHGANP